MEVRASQRVQALGAYAFAEVDREVEKLRAQGIEPIDFGVGDPTDPTPELVRAACKAGVDRHARSGYPSYVGSRRFREAVAAWTQRRHGVTLDPDTHVASTIGSKEAVFHAAEALVDPGDIVLCPSPGYPPYYRGTRFAEGTPHAYPMRAEDGFLPDLARIPADVARRARVLWINYPNSPSGRIAPFDYLARTIEWARERGIVVCSDEAYSELYFTGEAPRSALECGLDGVLVFQSLSKRSCMTGYRVGWVSGDPRLVGFFKKVKTNIDSGTADFIQDAAVAALGDEAHVEEARRLYRERRDALVEGLARAGLERCAPDGTIYVWQRLPSGMSSVDFAKRLLAPEVAVVCTPGAWLAEPLTDGTNPGEGHVRFALVPSVEKHREAAERIARVKLG